MKRLFILICFLVYLIESYGQISTDEIPISFRSDITFQMAGASVDLKKMPSLNMDRIGQEDLQEEKDGVPPRFGFLHKVNFDLNNSGTWTTLANGDKIWQLSIYCPNALSINLLYEKFWIPGKAKFFVYSENKKHILGAFTSFNNKGTIDNIQGFATGLVYSDKITLEYYQPSDVKEKVTISIAYVVHGYRYINLPDHISKSFGGSGDCQVNVNCSEGQNWQNEKNSVALILVNGNRYCTGSLINTTANDNRPVFLTADHCLGGWANEFTKYDAIDNPNLNHWSFYWNYESPSCSNSNEPPIKSTVGATVLANNSVSDFALLRLEENPIYETGVTTYFLGWDCSGNSGTGGVGIHHPAGDVKKIATYNITPSNSDCFNSGNTNFWKINWQSTTHGWSVTEGGSSGSPLINNNHKLIGQLYGSGPLCSNPNCSNPSQDIGNYGKFSVSWTGDGATDSRRRLSDWLDPCGSNVTTLNGVSSFLFSISGPSLVCSSGSAFTINNLPSGSTITWYSSQNMTRVSSQGDNPCTFQANGSGNGWINASISSPCDTNTTLLEAYNVWVGYPSAPTIYSGYESNPVPINSVYYPYITNSPGADPSTGIWESYGCVTLVGSTSGSSTEYLSCNNDGCGTIYVSTSNECGTYYRTPITVITGSGGDCGELPERAIMSGLSISPNPADDYIDITFGTSKINQKNEKFFISIYDLNSKPIKQIIVNNNKTRISVAELPIGTYVVLIKGSNTKLQGKFIIQR